MSAKNSIARSSVVMAAGTLASRVLGLVRNALLIAALGATASGAADAFNIANMLPTQLYNLIIGGVLNAILVPQIVRVMRERNGDELVNRLLTAAASVIAAITAVLTIAAPLVITLYASGLDRWQPLAYAFAFWFMPQVFFYGLYALWGQVLNARHNFGPYMWAPVVNNIISIVAILAYLRLYGSYTQGQDPGLWDAGRITLVGGTTTLGIAVQALILYLPLRRSGFRPRFVWGVKGTGLGSMSKVALWALAGTAVVSLGDLAVTNLGSRAVTAAESAQYAGVTVPSTTMYANALLVYMLPQSLVTTSVITALFTRMSEKAAAGDREGVRADLSLGLRSVGVFTVLFAVGIATLSAPALQLFVPSISLEQARASAPILTVLALGIPFQGIWFTTQRVMLAYADTKRLVRADCVVGAVAVLGCVLSYLLAPANQWMMWAAAANAASLAAASAAVVPLLRRHLPSLDGRRVGMTYARLVGAALPTFVTGWALRQLLGPADGSLTGTRATDALLTVLLAAVLMTLVYLAAGRALRVTELGVLFGPLSRLVLAAGRRLPGGAGEALRRLGGSLALPTRPEEQQPDVSEPTPAGSVPQPGWQPVVQPETQPFEGPSRQAAGQAAPAPSAVERSPFQEPGDAARLSASAPTAQDFTRTEGGPTMVAAGHPASAEGAPEGTPIGSGRYRLTGPLPATLPHVVRHSGRDTILDRKVTVLALTAATHNRQDVLSTAARAVLVDDPRLQRVLDVEHADPGHIIIEPASGRTLTTLLESRLTPEQVRALVGEVAEALDACSRRGLHHLNLSPESVRLRDDGTVQLSGIGINATLLGLQEGITDPLAPDRTDARALVELLYYALTGMWPGKRPGIAPAPMHGGQPAPPSSIVPAVAAHPELDAIVERTWGPNPPQSAAEVVHALKPWDPWVLPVTEVVPEPSTALMNGASRGRGASTSGLVTAYTAVAGGVAHAASGAKGVLARLKSRSSARAASSAGGPGVVGPGGAAAVAGPGPFGAPATGPGPVPASAPDGGAPDLRPTAPQAAVELTPEMTVELTRGFAPDMTVDLIPDLSVDLTPTSAPTPPPTAVPMTAPGAPAAPGGPGLTVEPSLPAPSYAPRASSLESLVHPQHPGGASPAGVGTTASGEVGDVAATQPQDDEARSRPNPVMIVVTVLAVIALGVGVFYAANNLIHLGRLPVADEDIPAARTVPTATAAEDPASPDDGQPPAAAPVIVKAESLDPYGDNNEHPELTANLIDGNTSTEWYSRFYAASSLAWKQGIGLAVTLEAPAQVSSIQLQGTGRGGNVQIRATTPDNPTGGTLLAEGPLTQGTTTFEFPATSAGSIVIWVTDLPTASDGLLKMTVTEITLR